MSLDLLGEASRRLDAGDPSSALRLAERALESGRASGSPKALASAAHLVGECLYATGDIAGSRRAVNEALAVTQTLGDPEALGADMNLWGILEITEGRTEDAIALLRRSYELREEALGPEHPDTIESLNNLAVAYWRVGAEDEAIALHEDALGRCERALGEDHRRTAETLNALAVKLASRPESQARARELYERGLVAAEAALGPDADLVARLLTNVAAARIDNGDHQSARPLLERSLELHERHFGRDSRWTAYVLSNLGELAWHEGRFDEARRVFERAFVIRMYELGPTEPETLESAVGLLNTLTEIAGEPRPVEQLDELFSGEAADEATALYLPLLAFHPELEEGFPGGGKPDPATAAEQLRRIADRIATRTAPDAAQAEAIGRADELVAQADASYLEGDLDSAAALLREAVALLETARGATDTSLVEPLQRLKLVLRVAGTESEVLPILRRIAAILADAYGEVHPLAIRALGEVYWQERRDYGPAGGRESAARMESLVQQALGEQSVVGRAVREVIAAAREAGAGVEPEDPPLSVRRERILAEADPLVDELLHDLDATPWPSLDHAYGPAIDTPRHVRLLLAKDERVRADALDLLGDSVLSEESLYSATVPVVRLVRRLAGEGRVPGRDRLIAFLTAAAVAAREAAPVPLREELVEVLGDLPALFRELSADPDPAVSGAARFALGELDRGA